MDAKKLKQIASELKNKAQATKIDRMLKSMKPKK